MDNDKEIEPLTIAERNKLVSYLMDMQLIWIPLHRESKETIESYSDIELLRQVKMHEHCIKEYKA